MYLKLLDWEHVKNVVLKKLGTGALAASSDRVACSVSISIRKSLIVMVFETRLDLSPCLNLQNWTY